MENNFINSLPNLPIEPIESSPSVKKKWFKKPAVIIIVGLLLIAGAAYSGYSYFASSPDNANENQNENKATPVETIILDATKQQAGEINTVGTVKAEAQINAVAMANGTVLELYFKVGDEVAANQVLARLNDSLAIANLNNANINYQNLQNSLSASQQAVTENIKQTEVGLASAKEAVNNAKTALAAAENNLENSLKLQIDNEQNLKSSSIISYHNYLNAAKNALDQINYLIQAEGEYQLPGANNVLGAQNAQSLASAKEKYWLAKNNYNSALGQKVNVDNITTGIKNSLAVLEKTKEAVFATIIVLNNTVSSVDFNDVTLIGQKNNFDTIYNSLANTQAAAENNWQNLNKLDLVQKQEQDALNNAVKSARGQLNLAEIGYQNAAAVLEAAKQNANQQITSSENAVKSARGQLNLTQVQVADLTIKAPISGKITKKYVDRGTEVSPGKNIAQISQTDRIKIEISLTAADVYRLKIGQTAKIENGGEGTLVLIEPTADTITKKVGAEIFYDNQNNDLIAGTFTNISLPLLEIKKTSANSFFIPLKAVNIKQEANFVWLIENNQVAERQVEIGRTTGALIEIISGLNNGDQVIVTGGKNLKTGDPVDIIKS